MPDNELKIQADGGLENVTVPEPQFETVTKTRKKTVRAPLKVGGPGFASTPLPPDLRKARQSFLWLLHILIFHIFTAG